MMRHMFIIPVALLILTPAVLLGQEVGTVPTAPSAQQPSHVDVSLFAAAEHPSVFSDLKIRTTDLLEASLVVENKGGNLTYAPLLFGLREYRQWASELRLRLSQKDTLTTLGIGSQYNPLSPRGARGSSLWMAGGGSTPANALRTAIGERIQPREDRLKELRAAYAEKSRLPPAATEADLKRIRGEMSALTDDILRIEAELVPLKQELAALDAAEQLRIDIRIRDFYRTLLQTSVPVIGLAYNTTLFSVLGGNEVDTDNDGLNDVAHRVRKHSLSVSADSRLSERLQLSGLLSTEWDRGSAEEGSAWAQLYGAAVTFGGIVAVLNRGYATSKAYLESLFIPSVVLGGAFEYRLCDNAGEAGVVCPDKLHRLTVFTPFVDLKVVRTTQFRVGIPIRRSKAVTGSSATDLGVVTAITLQLSEPK